MISVIVPALNEAESLPETLAHARQALALDDEIIVVDGGSRDATCEIADQCGARIVESERGRGRQMNAGAKAARGDVLLFLHADTLLPLNAGALVRQALENPAVLGGNFALRFDAPGLLPGFFARIYNARSRRQRFFYGDSALWVRREVFDALGGFGEARLMEDWAFCLRLRAEAKQRHPDLPLRQTLPLIESPVITSARRFHGRRGLAWKMIAVWSLLHVLYACGVSADWLERRFYPAAKT